MKRPPVLTALLMIILSKTMKDELLSFRLPMYCCITKRNGTLRESLVTALSIAQSWLSVTQTTHSISFWKESISFILRGLFELGGGVRAKL